MSPLLFNIHVNDLVYISQNTDICNFAGGSTVYLCGKTSDEILIEIEEDLCQALEWFKSNILMDNPPIFNHNEYSLYV